MPTPLLLTLLVLSLASLATLLYWSVVAVYAARAARNFPTARTALDFPEASVASGDCPSVCLIVPAHNEASIIGVLARSLRAQDYPNLRIVFALDRCTDNTRAIVESESPPDRPYEIIEIAHCPADWAGKVNAMWQAVTTSASAADADVLLFADADTSFHPSCVRAAVALLRNQRLDMVSLLSTLTSDLWFERHVQPAAAMELVRQYPLHRINRHERRRPFANGQFILITRDAYQRVGGHAAVRNEIFEDVRFAQHADKNKLRIGVFVAAGMLHCRMYANWAEFQRGWNRIYSEAANRKPIRLHRAARRARIVGIGFPLAAAAAVALGLVAWRQWGGDGGAAWGIAAAGLGAGALLVYWGTLIAAYIIGGMPLRSVLTYPFGVWLTAGILAQTARDLEDHKPTIWAGREYQRDAR